MTANIIGALPAEAYAAGSAESRTYEKEGYNVTYRIEGEWQDHHRIEITLQNTGDEPILNWALKYESSGELSDLWNSRLYERNEEFVIIKNSGYNYKIEPAGSVTCGYIVTGENCIIPENIELCSRRIDVSSGYDVDLDIINDWHTGFQAEVEIENTSDEPIEAWTLFFNGNFTINNLWDAKLLANENGSYEIANQLWTTPIKPGEKTSFGFTADKSATVEAKAENYRLTAVVIGESSLEYEPVTDFEQDSDSDGLPDYYEKILGTDPKNADTDGDGLSDGYEVMYLGTDPLKADSDDNGINDGDEDSDNDGLSNLKECELGTDPKNADTDGDGLSDGEEVNKYRTDPLKYDTDGDKISDGDEIKLGLDPKSTLSNGILDNERIFEQTLPSDSDAFSAINSDEETPFDVSIDIKAAGAAESNIAVRESGYSNIIENSAIIGTAPEFIYTDGLKVDEVTVKFELEESVVNNTLGIYADESDEFKGIKRFNVFRYFEDINMLLPIETFHDEASKTVYAKTDRMGTYCLVDMEIFLDNLSEQLNSEDQLENEVRVEESEAMSKNTADEYICCSVDKYEAKASSEDDFDVVFLIDSRKLVSKNGSTDFEVIKRNITEAADTIFIKSPNAHVRIVVMNPMLGSGWDKSTYRVMKVSDIRGVEPSKNNSFFTNYEDVCSAIEEIRNENRSGEDCNLTDALRDTYEYAKAVRRKTIIFCLFKAKGTLYQSKNESAYDFLNDIRDNSLDISINAICDDSDQSEKYGYAVDMCNMTKGLFSDGYEHSSEMMLSQIYVDGGKIQNAYKVIIATGYKTVKLDGPITNDCIKAAQNTENCKNRKLISDLYSGYADTDKDGLFDFEEIMFQMKYDNYDEKRWLIDNTDPDNIKLLTYSQILDIVGEEYFYVEKGLERYRNMTDEVNWNPDSLMNAYVLPIKSDPTSVDGDGDGIIDRLDGFALIADNDMPIIFKILVTCEKAKYEDILLLSEFSTDQKAYLCNVSLADMFKEKCFLDVAAFDAKGNISNADEYVGDYYLLAYGSGDDANYYSVKWYDYSFIKKIKVLNTTGKIRKYSQINYDELRQEYGSYDFWASLSEAGQRWLKNVSETDEKNIQNIRDSVNYIGDSIDKLAQYSVGYVVIDVYTPGLRDHVETNIKALVTGFEIKAYETISSTTKTPTYALMMPSSVIERDYLYRKEYKQKYGVDPGKHLLRSLFATHISNQSDSVFMSIDEFDSEFLTGTSQERMEYIGGKLWDACFRAYLKELIQKAGNAEEQYKKETGKPFDIEEVKKKDKSKRSNLENEIIDVYDYIDITESTDADLSEEGVTSIVVYSELSESLTKLTETVGDKFLCLMSDCQNQANELIVLSIGNEAAIKDLLQTNYSEFVNGVNLYGMTYAELAVKYGVQFVQAVDIYPQYAGDIIRIVNEYEYDAIEVLRSGVTPKAIVSLEEIGLTPDDFYGKGKIRNLRIESDDDAKILIDSRNKIHSLFSDDELSELKLVVLEHQNKLKSEYTGKAPYFTPAVAGVAYRNSDGTITYYFGANDYSGTVPELPDILQKRKDEMSSDIISAAYENEGAIGSHAEIYAVTKMFKEHPTASNDDFVIYVNYSRPYNSPTTGRAFYTCAHCKELLKEFNILSNVEGF